MDVHGMLHLLKAEPTLLPIAPDGASGGDIEKRCGEEHSCLSCGKRATVALIVADPLEVWEGKRWLDLCYAHFNEVRAHA